MTPGGANKAAITYESSGVSIQAGDEAVELMKAWVDSARRPEVVGGIGGFAGLFDASGLKQYRRPLLATSADGVGTKVQIAQRMDIHDTIGYDLVGMLVDDLVVCGAEPLFMTDYIACGSVVPERIAQIVKGIAQACAETGTALLGGETAEHPGLMGVDEYDIAGSTTGVVEADSLLGAERVSAGDVVIAMASSGLHSNGYSLARHVFFDVAGWALDRKVPEFGRALGEELLEPTRLYTKPCLGLLQAADVHAISHVTGGGLAANIARVVPGEADVHIERNTWLPPAVFSVLAELGEVAQPDLEQALNMGVGMVAITSANDAEKALQSLAQAGIDAWIAGSVVRSSAGEGGNVFLHGEHF